MTDDKKRIALLEQALQSSLMVIAEMRRELEQKERKEKPPERVTGWETSWRPGDEP